jgi:ABC-2 type transport system ATP-binding protein
MPDVLTVRNARKSFNTTTALDGAALSLASGEWLGLLGPNGAGKTTLVRAIAGRVRLDDGTIALHDTPLDGTAAADRERRALGVVPQEIALYPNLTAAENLRAFGALHGLDAATLARRIEWALDFTGLADRSGEPIRRFSGGMKRRLNIACAVLHEPSVILLDEPTVGVDPQSRQRIWEMLEQLRGDGASLLLTTHQLDEAQQVCERIVIIDHGRDIATGTFTELVRQTVGSGRRVRLDLEAAPPPALVSAGYESLDGDAVARVIDDVGRDLPAMLTEVDKAGARVRDVHIDAPSLQSVFIHLTGRELRE